MPSLNDFVMQKPRPLPVVIAVDRSGSMGADGKIDALNMALHEFINSIKGEDTGVDLQVALYSFGGNNATCELPLTPIDNIDADNYSFSAEGRTPMGQAFVMIKELIEDKNRVPSRSYRPTIVLITDGIPTDDYENAMSALINEGRSSKSFRIAMAIGADADKNMLARFVSSAELLMTGDGARDIKKFFRFVTMSVTSRMKSQTPDTPQTVILPNDEIIL